MEGNCPGGGICPSGEMSYTCTDTPTNCGKNINFLCGFNNNQDRYRTSKSK